MNLFAFQWSFFFIRYKENCWSFPLSTRCNSIFTHFVFIRFFSILSVIWCFFSRDEQWDFVWFHRSVIHDWLSLPSNRALWLIYWLIISNSVCLFFFFSSSDKTCLRQCQKKRKTKPNNEKVFSSRTKAMSIEEHRQANNKEIQPISSCRCRIYANKFLQKHYHLLDHLRLDDQFLIALRKVQ